MWRRFTTAAPLVSMLLVASCTGGVIDSTTTTSSTTPSAPTSTLPPVVECPGAGQFGEGGGIADVDGEGSDASHLGQISWESAVPCETFSFVFETSEGAPATTVPDIKIDHLESFQVIRIAMDVDAAVVTDQLVETGLVDRLYVVSGLDGGMFVDLHLNAPAAARARLDSSPARLTVDLRPGFVEFTGAAKGNDSTVVVSPTADATIDPIAALHGYTRALDGNVTLIITQGGNVVETTNVIAADNLRSWGEFTAELALPPGQVEIFVGESDPEDGTLSGVSLDLTVS